MQSCDTDILGSVPCPIQLSRLLIWVRDHSADKRNGHLWREQRILIGQFIAQPTEDSFELIEL